jgi:hypothetical protein
MGKRSINYLVLDQSKLFINHDTLILLEETCGSGIETECKEYKMHLLKIYEDTIRLVSVGDYKYQIEDSLKKNKNVSSFPLWQDTTTREPSFKSKHYEIVYNDDESISIEFKDSGFDLDSYIIGQGAYNNLFSIINIPLSNIKKDIVLISKKITSSQNAYLELRFFRN